MKNSFEKIYEVVNCIPEGKVASYGQIAELAGNRRWARVVGYALHAVPEEKKIPWHRVVKKDGEVYGGAESSSGKRQIDLLKKEGIKFDGEYVDMKKYQWKKRLV